MNAPNSSLVVGTAQLGFPYGISNTTGQPDPTTAAEIVSTAWDNGIREFDTAQDYGTSEQVLGLACAHLNISRQVQITSKLAPELNHLDQGAINASVEKSLHLLGVPSLHALLIHSEILLPLWNQGLAEIMMDLNRAGRVQYTGISVYSPEKALQALQTDGLDIVQLPSNIFDRRFERAGVFELAAEKRKKIYIRSVFLQGLILMDSDMLPTHMKFAGQTIKKLGLFAREAGLTRREVALGYLKATYPDANLIVGVETPKQLKGNIISWQTNLSPHLITQIQECFSAVDEKILTPMLWAVES